MSKNTKLPDLEVALEEINVLVEQMEHGNLSLELSLERFERGVTLVKHCQKILQDAEQKVQVLIQTNGQDLLQAYENPSE